jgi:hypothetical protein
MYLSSVGSALDWIVAASVPSSVSAFVAPLGVLLPNYALILASNMASTSSANLVLFEHAPYFQKL